MIDKQKQNLNMKVQWAKFAVVLALYLLFLIWVESWLGLIVVPFIFDVYITKKIHWQWWKDEEGPIRFIMSWAWACQDKPCRSRTASFISTARQTRSLIMCNIPIR